jgi:3-hydroxyacyl-[acyl-carrier-protein] dehydratase
VPSETHPAEPKADVTVLDINQIMEILPHRYPFLLIDRVVELVPKQRVVAIKNVTINEPYFQGHFPGYPIMPGVLMVEAIAQAGGALLLTEIPDRGDKLMVFTGIEKAKFRRPVVPGDQVRLEVDVLQWRPRAVKLQGNAYVAGKLVCEATITCQLVPRQKPASAPVPLAEPVPEVPGVTPVAVAAEEAVVVSQE